ncbi:MAG: biopolymer transporter ExbD [Brumimicrobium sp.]|nr:biopolymer transporter ExbD [Brumimicrobium sp.]MCO5267394.1 biopolymer transporter ExbD [Brumimicrobium sp.]
MSKFRKKEGSSAPGINTSSLPDIVFMLLFFFMVATTTKEVDPLVKIDPAQGSGLSDLTPFKQRSEVDFVYMGEPLSGDDSKFYKGVAVQYDGILHQDGIEYIGQWKLNKFKEKPAEMTAPKENVITCFKADETVPMELIFKARGILQDLDFNSIAYGAQEMGNKHEYRIRTK